MATSERDIDTAIEEAEEMRSPVRSSNRSSAEWESYRGGRPSRVRCTELMSAPKGR